MDGDSPEVDAANAGNGRLGVDGSGTWKGRDDLERLFKFLGEHVGVVAIGQPPCFLAPNVFLRSGGELNVAVFQRDRSSRRTTSASRYLLRIEALDRSAASREPAAAQTVITVR